MFNRKLLELHNKNFRIVKKSSLIVLSIVSSILGIALLYDRTEVIDKALSWQFNLEFIFPTLLIFLSILASYAYFKGENKKEKTYAKEKIRPLAKKRIAMVVLFIGISTLIINWLLYVQSYSHLLFVAWISSIAIAAIALKRIDKGRSFSFRTTYTDYIFLGILLSIATLLYSYDNTSWKWVGLGDNGVYYDHAKGGLTNIKGNLFSFKEGVHGYALVSTAFQAAVMDLVGHNAFGWKFSSQLPIFVAAIFLYFLVIDVYNNKKYAMIGYLLFTLSHFLIVFSHGGYNNTQGLPFITLSLLFLSATLKRDTLFNLFMLGVVAASSIYTYEVAIFIIPVVFLAFIFYGKRTILNISILLMGILIAILPAIIINPQIIELAKNKTAFHMEGNPANPVEILLKNVVATSYSSIAFNSTHFVNGALLDPFTAILFVLGIGYCIANKKLHFILLSLVIGGLFVGVGSHYHYPATHRMFLLMPFLILVACASLRIVEIVPIPKIFLFILILGLVASSNTYKSQFMRNTHVGYYNIENALINRYISENQEATVYIVNVPNDMHVWMPIYFPKVKYIELKIDKLDSINLKEIPVAIISNLDAHNAIVKKYPTATVKIYQDHDPKTLTKIYVAEYK